MGATLWRAPVPWLHRHDHGGMHDAATMHHLQIYHSHDIHREDGWHWHFSWLDDILAGSGAPVPAEKARQAPSSPELGFSASTPDVAMSCSDCSIDWVNLPANERIIPLMVSRARTEHRARQPLEEFAATNSLLLLLGIARC